MNWSPVQYSKFEAERTRPVRDLVAQIANERVGSAADLGCGPGNSTEVLSARFPTALITGIDSSAEMLEYARKRLPSAAFEQTDIVSWSKGEGKLDVILANASLQWVPDHETLLPALLSRLERGGSLAVQIPDNLEEPAHRLMQELAHQAPWAEKLANTRGINAVRHDAEWYYRALFGSTTVNLWHTTYYHRLEGGAEGVVEWFRGTALRPFLSRLDETEQERFLESYRALLESAYPVLADGSVLLPFPRLLFIARRAV